jgi:putative ABC transport system permease protein
VRWIDSRAMARPVKTDGADAGAAQGVERAIRSMAHRAAGRGRSPMRSPSDGVWGAVVEEAALRRMNVALGDACKVGDVTVELRGIIAASPTAAERLREPRPAPHDSARGDADSGLVQPAACSPGSIACAAVGRPTCRHRGIKNRFPNAGWRCRAWPMPVAASASGSTG